MSRLASAFTEDVLKFYRSGASVISEWVAKRDIRKEEFIREQKEECICARRRKRRACTTQLNSKYHYVDCKHATKFRKTSKKYKKTLLPIESDTVDTVTQFMENETKTIRPLTTEGNTKTGQLRDSHSQSANKSYVECDCGATFTKHSHKLKKYSIQNKNVSADRDPVNSLLNYKHLDCGCGTTFKRHYVNSSKTLEKRAMEDETVLANKRNAVDAGTQFVESHVTSENNTRNNDLNDNQNAADDRSRSSKKLEKNVPVNEDALVDKKKSVDATTKSGESAIIIDDNTQNNDVKDAQSCKTNEGNTKNNDLKDSQNGADDNPRNTEDDFMNDTAEYVAHSLENTITTQTNTLVEDSQDQNITDDILKISKITEKNQILNDVVRESMENDAIIIKSKVITEGNIQKDDSNIFNHSTGTQTDHLNASKNAMYIKNDNSIIFKSATDTKIDDLNAFKNATETKTYDLNIPKSPADTERDNLNVTDPKRHDLVISKNATDTQTDKRNKPKFYKRARKYFKQITNMRMTPHRTSTNMASQTIPEPEKSLESAGMINGNAHTADSKNSQHSTIDKLEESLLGNEHVSKNRRDAVDAILQHEESFVTNEGNTQIDDLKDAQNDTYDKPRASKNLDTSSIIDEDVFVNRRDTVDSSTQSEESALITESNTQIHDLKDLQNITEDKLDECSLRNESFSKNKKYTVDASKQSIENAITTHGNTQIDDLKKNQNITEDKLRSLKKFEQNPIVNEDILVNRRDTVDATTQSEESAVRTESNIDDFNYSQSLTIYDKSATIQVNVPVNKRDTVDIDIVKGNTQRTNVEDSKNATKNVEITISISKDTLVNSDCASEIKTLYRKSSKKIQKHPSDNKSGLENKNIESAHVNFKESCVECDCGTKFKTHHGKTIKSLEKCPLQNNNVLVDRDIEEDRLHSKYPSCVDCHCGTQFGRHVRKKSTSLEKFPMENETVLVYRKESVDSKAVEKALSAKVYIQTENYKSIIGNKLPNSPIVHEDVFVNTKNEIESVRQSVEITIESDMQVDDLKDYQNAGGEQSRTLIELQNKRDTVDSAKQTYVDCGYGPKENENVFVNTKDTVDSSTQFAESVNTIKGNGQAEDSKDSQNTIDDKDRTSVNPAKSLIVNKNVSVNSKGTVESVARSVKSAITTESIDQVEDSHNSTDDKPRNSKESEESPNLHEDVWDDSEQCTVSAVATDAQSEDIKKAQNSDHKPRISKMLEESVDIIDNFTVSMGNMDVIMKNGLVSDDNTQKDCLNIFKKAAATQTDDFNVSKNAMSTQTDDFDVSNNVNEDVMILKDTVNAVIHSADEITTEDHAEVHVSKGSQKAKHDRTINLREISPILREDVIMNRTYEVGSVKQSCDCHCICDTNGKTVQKEGSPEENDNKRDTVHPVLQSVESATITDLKDCQKASYDKSRSSTIAEKSAILNEDILMNRRDTVDDITEDNHEIDYFNVTKDAAVAEIDKQVSKENIQNKEDVYRDTSKNYAQPPTHDSALPKPRKAVTSLMHLTKSESWLVVWEQPNKHWKAIHLKKEPSFPIYEIIRKQYLKTLNMRK